MNHHYVFLCLLLGVLINFHFTFANVCKNKVLEVMGTMDRIMAEVKEACPKDVVKKYFPSLEDWEKIGSMK